MGDEEFYTLKPNAALIFQVFVALFAVINISENFAVVLSIVRTPALHSALHWLLVNIAVSDLLLAVFLLPRYVFYKFLPGSGDTVCLFLSSSTIARVGIQAQIFTLMVISIERYIAVVYPHSTRGRLTITKLKVVMVSSWLYAIGFNIPDFIYIRYSLNKTRCIYDWSPTIHKTWALLWFFTSGLLPLVTMGYLYGRVVYDLWIKKNRAVDASRNAIITSRKRVTKIVITITIVYGLCVLPFMPIRLISNLGKSIPHLDILVTLSHMFLLFNSTIKPFVYCIQSEHFRKCMMATLMCCKRYNTVSLVQDMNTDYGSEYYRAERSRGLKIYQSRQPSGIVQEPHHTFEYNKRGSYNIKKKHLRRLHANAVADEHASDNHLDTSTRRKSNFDGSQNRMLSNPSNDICIVDVESSTSDCRDGDKDMEYAGIWMGEQGAWREIQIIAPLHGGTRPAKSNGRMSDPDNQSECTSGIANPHEHLANCEVKPDGENKETEPTVSCKNDGDEKDANSLKDNFQVEKKKNEKDRSVSLTANKTIQSADIKADQQVKCEVKPDGENKETVPTVSCKKNDGDEKDANSLKEDFQVKKENNKKDRSKNLTANETIESADHKANQQVKCEVKPEGENKETEPTVSCKKNGGDEEGANSLKQNFQMKKKESEKDRSGSLTANETIESADHKANEQQTHVELNKADDTIVNQPNNSSPTPVLSSHPEKIAYFEDENGQFKPKDEFRSSEDEKTGNEFAAKEDVMPQCESNETPNASHPSNMDETILKPHKNSFLEDDEEQDFGGVWLGETGTTDTHKKSEDDMDSKKELSGSCSLREDYGGVWMGDNHSSPSCSNSSLNEAVDKSLSCNDLKPVQKFKFIVKKIINKRTKRRESAPSSLENELKGRDVTYTDGRTIIVKPKTEKGNEYSSDNVLDEKREKVGYNDNTIVKKHLPSQQDRLNTDLVYQNQQHHEHEYNERQNIAGEITNKEAQDIVQNHSKTKAVNITKHYKSKHENQHGKKDLNHSEKQQQQEHNENKTDIELHRRKDKKDIGAHSGVLHRTQSANDNLDNVQKTKQSNKIKELPQRRQDNETEQTLSAVYGTIHANGKSKDKGSAENTDAKYNTRKQVWLREKDKLKVMSKLKDLDINST